MIKKPITIQLSEGLDARPIALLVQEASQYSSTVYIEVADKQVNAKSIMGIFSLDLSKPLKMIVHADSDAAADFVEEAAKFIAD